MRFWQQHYYNNYQFSSESSGGNNNNNININDNINITSINTHNHHGLEILNNTTLNFARPQSPAHTASITATQKKLRELPRIITNFPKRKSCQQQPQPQPQQNEIKTSISNNNNNNNNKKKSSNVQQSVKFALDPSHSRKHQKSESDHNIITNGSKKNGNVNDNRYRVLRRSSAPVTGLSYNNNNKPPVSRIDLLTGRQMGRESEENSTIPMVIVDNHGHVNDKHNDSESSLFSSPPQQSRNNDYENNFNNINNINSSNFSSSISSSLTSNTCSLSPFIPPSLTPSSSVSSLNSSVGQLSPFFTSNNNKDTNNSDNNDNNNDRGRILLNTMSTTLPSQSQRPPPPSSSLTAPLQPPSSNNFNTRPKSKSISTEHPFAIESFISPVTPASYGDLPWSPAVSFLSSLASATANTPLPDDEGQQVGDYVLGKVIGRGGFSTVREGYTIDDSCTMEKVAVKIVKNDQNCEENDRVQSLLEREIAIWRELDHPNILPMFSVEETEYATFIFSEFCPGGTLLNYIKNNSSQSGKGLSEEESRRIFLEMAEALRYLHNDMRLVHKDVKLDNILLDKDGDWKLCDFGLTEFQNPEVNGFANLDEPAGGSLAYSSPEQLRSKTSIRNPAVDIWSLGVVLFAMVTGQLPFTDGYEPRLQYNIINGRYDESILCKAGASEELCDLLKGMFKTKPEQRLTINQVLEHPWCQP